MKLYRIEKGNLIKTRRVFRPLTTIELSDVEAASFRAAGGELSDAGGAATEVPRDGEELAASPEVNAAPPEIHAISTKTRRQRQ